MMGEKMKTNKSDLFKVFGSLLLMFGTMFILDGEIFDISNGLKMSSTIFVTTIFLGQFTRVLQEEAPWGNTQNFSAEQIRGFEKTRKLTYALLLAIGSISYFVANLAPVARPGAFSYLGMLIAGCVWITYFGLVINRKYAAFRRKHFPYLCK